jgi:hypothetical protein
MASKLSSEIASKIVDYFSGELSVEELQDWLAPLLWDIEEKDDPEASSMAYGVELALSEYAHGHLTDDQLKADLRVLVPDYSASGDKVKTACAVEISRLLCQFAVRLPGVAARRRLVPVSSL